MNVDPFKHRNVLVTGGLGFTGSNLAIRLVGLGAHVTLVDAMLPDYGGNLFNIEPIKGRVRVNYSDIRDPNAMNWLVRDMDYVFHLAGQVCHVMSLTDPFPDIDINIKGTAVVMEALKNHNPRATVVYTGTRGEYGSVVKLPVSEEAPTNPKGMYEISNLTAEKIVQVYHDTHGIPGVMLRITNTYGPRGQMRHSRFGVVNWFIRLALSGQPITVFGDGGMIRDFVYIDDCVDAIVAVAQKPEAMGEVFNVGVDQPTTIGEICRTIADLTGAELAFVPPTADRAALEPGHFYSDITKIRTIVGWEPKTDLRDGLGKTVDYYRKYREHYWS